VRAILSIGARNPVLLNILFAFVVLLGLASWNWLPKEQFPQVSVDRVAVVVPWPGASPADIEDAIARPVEDAVASIEGLDHVFGEIVEGRATLTLEFVRGTDVDAALDEVQRAVAGVEEIPDDALEPIVTVVRIQVPIIHVGLLGDITQLSLAEQLSDELRAIPGVKKVDINGAAPPVVRVDLDPAMLVARGLTPEAVGAAIQAAGQGLPAGSVSLGGQQVLVRTPKGLQSLDDIRSVPVDQAGDVQVADVARVWVDHEDPAIFRHINGQSAIRMVLFRNDDANTFAVVEAVEAWAVERQASLPEGLELVAYDDSGRFVKDRISVVFGNAVVGLLLVFACLWAFIGARNAVMVVWGMPVAYLGAVIAMYLSDISVNVISTFGLLVVTGIIVDDAVVIVENVQRHLERGKDRVQAAIDGTMEVLPAVTASTITTCLAFGPLLLLEGTVGRVMSIIPQVVIFSLLASLLEAFIILPGHLSHYAEERVSGENALTRWLKGAYRPVLDLVTRPVARYGALVMLTLGFMLTMSLTLVMRTSLQAPGKPYFAFVNVDLPRSTAVEETRAALADLERFVLEEGPGTLWINANSGRQLDPSDFPTDGARFGQLKIGFPDAVFSEVDPFLARLRTRLEADPRFVDHAIETVQGGPPAGRDIDVKVRSRSPDAVGPVAAAITAHLESRPGVRDVRNEAGEGTEEFRVDVDRACAARFGLREAQVAFAARAALDGTPAIELPLDERTTEVRVGLAWPQGEPDLEGLRDVPLRTQSGDVIRLRQVADVVRGRSVARISRVDGQRAVRVSALVDPDQTTPEREQLSLEAAFAEAQAEYPDADLFVGGALGDSNESFAKLPLVFMLAVIGIYGVLAVQFRSYLQPLIIVSAVPLGIAGAVLGLFLFGMDLSLIAMIGAVGLSGIVVNDSLVLVDFVNARRREGATAIEAVRDAALTRLRPILITTTTTVLGLGPLAFGLAGSDPLLAPMAVTISFGLAFATALTLVAIPVLYLVVEDVARVGGWGMRRLGRAAARQDAPGGPAA
jgi:multidrug efflux pump subunit AcrB